MNSRTTDHSPRGFDAAAGGFVVPLLSPPPSSVASSATAANEHLPRPRTQPLRSGSTKESAFINTVDKRILSITRKFANKQDNPQEPAKHGAETLEGTRGYSGFREAARDIERTIDIVWVSGTPSLQIPYLLNLALLALTFIPAFSPAPKAMFGILSKLDYAFASLIQGHDQDTGQSLPGFEGGRGMTATEKVRIKSLVERTRVAVVAVMAADDFEAEDEEANESEDELDGERVDGHDCDMDEGPMDHGMEIARVYDRTLVELGDTLGGPPIGLPDA